MAKKKKKNWIPCVFNHFWCFGYFPRQCLFLSLLRVTFRVWVASYNVNRKSHMFQTWKPKKHLLRYNSSLDAVLFTRKEHVRWEKSFQGMPQGRWFKNPLWMWKGEYSGWEGTGVGRREAVRGDQPQWVWKFYNKAYGFVHSWKKIVVGLERELSNSEPLVVLTEDPGLDPSTSMVAHNHSSP